jgi:hypothetical protein
MYSIKCYILCHFNTVSSKLSLPLTLSVRAEYVYSAAPRASCPDGVLVLRDFRKVVK